MIGDAAVSKPVSASKVEWAAILGGAVVTTALGLILLAFGAAIGFSVSSPYEGEGLSPAAFAVAAGLYLLWVQLMCFFIGGYITARMRNVDVGATEHESDVRDGLHGIMMWGVSVIAAAAVATVGLGGLGKAAEAPPNQITSSIAQVAAEEVNEQAAAERVNDEDGAVATAAERRAEVVRKMTIVSAFITAASLLIGLVASFYGAHQGGNHRDKNTTWVFFTSVARPRSARKAEGV